VKSCVAVLATDGPVVSGSIVIVGNVADWLEKQGSCQRAP